MFPVRSIFPFAVLLVLAALLLGTAVVWRERGTNSSGIEARPGTGALPERAGRGAAGSPERYRQLLARLQAVASEPDVTELEGQGLSAFHRITASLDSADFAALLQLDSGSVGLRLRLLQAWAELDPQAAAASLESAGLPPVEACPLLAGAWARQDLEGARVWVGSLATGESRDRALLALGGEAALRDPRLAIEILGDLEDSPQATGILTQAAATWTATEPEAAADWARSLEDPARREAVLGGIATAWADRDPYAAAQLVLDSIGDGSIEENSIVGIVQRLAFQDLDGARDWVARFPEGRTRERAEAEVQRVAGRLGR
jgi:hypothetical protein